MLSINNGIIVFISGLLTLVSVANAKIDISENGSDDIDFQKKNITEIFNVEANAHEYIGGLKKQLKVMKNDRKEAALVELARSLDYYKERYAKGQISEERILNEILDIYLNAASIALNNKKIRYSREISNLAVKLQRKDILVNTFDNFLLSETSEVGTYLAQIDYADGLAKFKDSTAEIHFQVAVAMRSPMDAVEAYYRYADYLLDTEKPKQALALLNQFSPEERRIYVHIVNDRPYGAIPGSA